jgi:hypothetical protein
MIPLSNEVLNKSVDQLIEENGGGSGIVLIPAGDYPAVCVKAEMKPTKDGQGQYLQLLFVITGGEHRDVEFIDRLNLVNNNTKAVSIALASYAKLCKAVGFNTIQQDEQAVLNKPLMLKIKTEKGEGTYKDRDGVERQSKDKSVIDTYLPSPAGIRAAATAGNGAASNSAMPWKR